MLVAGTPSKRSDRWDEIKSLNAELRAAGALQKMNNAFKWSESLTGLTSQYYLIEYDPESGQSRVRGYSSVTTGSDDRSRDQNEAAAANGVLVEIDKVENLRAAYPNYFMDVGAFTDNILRITEGRNETPTYIAKRRQGLDVSWLKDWRKPTG